MPMIANESWVHLHRYGRRLRENCMCVFCTKGLPSRGWSGSRWMTSSICSKLRFRKISSWHVWDLDPVCPAHEARHSRVPTWRSRVLRSNTVCKAETVVRITLSGPRNGPGNTRPVFRKLKLRQCIASQCLAVAVCDAQT